MTSSAFARRELKKTLAALKEMYDAQAQALKDDGYKPLLTVDMQGRPVLADLLIAISNVQIALARD